MKKLFTFLLVAICLVLMGNTANAQTTVFTDDFSANQNATYTTSGVISSSAWSLTRSGADWGGRRNTSPAQLELTNDVGGTANVAGWSYASVSLGTSFSSPYNTTLSSNTGVITWTFNMRTNRTNALGGFSAGSYGMAYILVSTSSAVNNTGSGYAVIMGGGTNNNMSLINFNNGIQGTRTTVIAFGNTPANTTNYISVKVTYDPSTNSWELFSRDDGASAFADPALGSFTQIGSPTTNSTYTGTAMSFSGTYWQGSTTATQTAFFDNVKCVVAPGALTPPTLTAAGGATVDAAFNVTFADDATWRAAITSITVGGVTLTAGSSVSSGQITFTPSASTPAGLLQTSGSKSIIVIATGYNNASVTQQIDPGTPTKLGIGTQPTAPLTNGSTLAQQPVIRIQDQYSNTTTSTATVVANVGSGTWTIGGTSSLAGVAGTVTFTNLTATSAASVTGATIDFTSTGLTNVVSGTFNIPAPVSQGLQLSAVGTSYLIDFDNTVANVNNGTYAGTGFSPSPSSGQLNSLSWAVTGWSNGNLAFGGTQTTASTDYTRGVSAVAVSTGGMYSFNIGGNRAMGIQPGGSDWEPGTMTLKVQNVTGVSATTLLISYKLLVRNDQDRSSSFNFSYSDDDVTYTPVSSLDLTSDAALDAAGWKTYIKVYTITLNLSNNGYYYFRWSGAAVGGSGSRDEFAIDDFNIIVNPTSSQYPTFSGTCQDINSDANMGLSADLTVNGTLTLTNGIINTAGHTLEIGTSISNVGALVRTGGAVRGPVKRWFATATTTSNTLFPVSNYHWVTGSGYTDDYTPVEISFTSGGPATGGSLTVTYDTTGSGTLFDNGGLGYIDVGAQWPGVNFINLTPQRWIITASGLAGFTYDISLTGNGMNVSTTATLYTGILKRPDNTQPWAWNIGNHTNTSGSITPILGGHGFTTFSEFAIGGNMDNLLPVELASFTSAVSGTSVTLSWSTGHEENNAGFDIERKSAATSWTKIGNVTSHGTVNTPNTYTFTDRTLASGKYNYRLKQIDFNGNYKYYELSNEVIIGTPSKYALTQNFPNPFNPSTSISYEIPATNFVSLKIYDMMGKEVANLVNGTQEAGFYTVKFDASKLASGVYFYKLQANDFTATKKLMLMK